MARLSIPPPKCMHLTGNLATNWESFEDNWENYILGTKLEKTHRKLLWQHYYPSWDRNVIKFTRIYP